MTDFQQHGNVDRKRIQAAGEDFAEVAMGVVAWRVDRGCNGSFSGSRDIMLVNGELSVKRR
jgi:hypothetical protein